MRNFDEEIKELTKDIENLEVKKKAQLQLLKKGKREIQEEERASVKAV